MEYVLIFVLMLIAVLTGIRIGIFLMYNKTAISEPKNTDTSPKNDNNVSPQDPAKNITDCDQGKTDGEDKGDVADVGVLARKLDRPFDNDEILDEDTAEAIAEKMGHQDSNYCHLKARCE